MNFVNESSFTDDQGQPKANFSPETILDRHVDELIGMCKMASADRIIQQHEAEYLLEWLEEHRKFANIYPMNILYSRVGDMLSDGVLDEEEQSELLEIILKMTGQAPEKPKVSDASTSLPLCDPAPGIVIEGRSFVFTGVFTVGTRKKCEEIVVSLGGEMHKNIKKTTNYLVIGDIGSEYWIHSTHGRKIEKAVKYRELGTGIHIVSEHHWIRYV